MNLGQLFLIEDPNANERDRVVIIVDDGDGTKIGLVVDELCGHQQVVIKSIEESYGSVPGIGAATILGNGRVAFILDIEKLAELAANPGTPPVASAGAAMAPKAASAAPESLATVH
jgi:two-component system chemotaxis sensor kinase CheA